MKIIIDLGDVPETLDPYDISDIQDVLYDLDLTTENAKPLITCEQCSKWRINDASGYPLCNRVDMDDIVWTDPDDFCKDATPKEINV